MSGKILLRQFSPQANQINVSNLPSGMYRVRFENENQVWLGRFVKE